MSLHLNADGTARPHTISWWCNACDRECPASGCQGHPGEPLYAEVEFIIEGDEWLFDPSILNPIPEVECICSQKSPSQVRGIAKRNSRSSSTGMKSVSD